MSDHHSKADADGQVTDILLIPDFQLAVEKIFDKKYVDNLQYINNEDFNF